MNYKSGNIPNVNFISRLLSLPGSLAKLEQLGTIKKYPKNHILVNADETVKYCYVVKTGRIVGYEFLPNGEERVYIINEQNSIILETNLLYDIPSAVSFRTLLPSTVIEIDKETLLNAMNNDSQITMDILQSVSMKFNGAMEQLRHSNYHNAEWKICDLLLQFAEHYGVYYDEKILIREKISQQLISNLLGINRVTAVRAIKHLKDMGLIEMINGFYCIRSIELLKKHQDWLLY